MTRHQTAFHLSKIYFPHLFLFFPLLLIVACSSNEEFLEPETSEVQNSPILKIGLVADPQFYSLREDSETRFYSKSSRHLKQAIDSFNHQKVDFVQNLGDIIERGWNNFDSILPIYNNLDPSIQNFHLLGNHEWYVEKQYVTDVVNRLGMESPYYSYQKSGWRFIVLDVTDHAVYTDFFKSETHQRQTQAYIDEQDRPFARISAQGAIGQEQQNWLQDQMKVAKEQNEKVIIYAHMPLAPIENDGILWNEDEIIDLIEGYSSNIVAYINGHRNSGRKVTMNNVHYITMTSMIASENNAFGIMTIYPDKIQIKGYGNQENYILDY